MGRNVFRLRPDAPTVTPETRSIFDFEDDDDGKGAPQTDVSATTQPLASKGIACLRSIGHPVSSGELSRIMIERKIVENGHNLLPKIHTALKRRPHEVELNADNKWELLEWIWAGRGENGHTPSA